MANLGPCSLWLAFAFSLQSTAFSLLLADTHYVDIASTNPTPPYTNWATAATVIQDAVDAATDGDTVLVADGVYSITSEIRIAKALRIQGVGGSEATTVRGAGSARCFALSNTPCEVIGFLITNGYSTGYGGGVYCDTTTPVLRNCTLSGNLAKYGAGVYRGTLYGCTLAHNTATSDGGGAHSSSLDACRVIGNVAKSSGGGTVGAGLRNSLVSGNLAEEVGGGCYGGSLYSCTIVGNCALGEGGGVNNSRMMNCIVYYNTAAVGPNYHSWHPDSEYCCTTPNPGGVGIITNPPLLTGVSHLSSASPCVGIGSSVHSRGSDIDGEAWQNPPCIGCDQLVAGAATGALSIAIIADRTISAAGWALNFTADVHGRTLGNVWRFGDGTAASNCPYVSHAWATTGRYDVVLTVQSDTFPEGLSATVQVGVVEQPVHYVDPGNDAPLSPYQSWADAATNIQDAIAAAIVPGSLVLVTNGIYETGGIAIYGNATNRVAVTNPVVVRSVNGPFVTVIRGKGPMGAGAVRCAYVGPDAVLSGFTLTEGCTRTSGKDATEGSGGGVWCAASALVLNCVIISNSAAHAGGGACGGNLHNCSIERNSATQRGGGVYGGRLHNCSVSSNLGVGAYQSTIYGSTLAGNTGGGAVGSTVYNSTLTGNSTSLDGGGAYGSTLQNCTVIGNWAGQSGGGVAGGSAMNCIVYYNSAPVGPNSLRSDLRYCCTTPNPGGVGIITNPPLLTGVSHLSSASPCIGAGTYDYCSGSDIDGETWQNPPCIGCDQLVAGAATGALSVAIIADRTISAAGWALNFTADIQGRTLGGVWQFGDGTAASNYPYVSHAWATTGRYDVVLTVQNDTFPEGLSATVQVSVVEQPVHYVDPGSETPLPPYQSWADAATNIQDAIAAAIVPGSLVLVTNGIYETGGAVVHGAMVNRIAITNPVVVSSVNGPTVTTIRGKGPTGDGAARCAFVGADAVLSGFTLAGGHTRVGGDVSTECSGGGVWCASSARVVDCVLTGNVAAVRGGGAAYGTFSNCTLTANSASYAGGVTYGRLFDCALLNNSANNEGGGAAWATLQNCTLRGNSAASGGGVYSGDLVDCVVISNNAASTGGGTCGGDETTLIGCRLTGNSAASGGGGAWQGTLLNCVLDGNSVSGSSGWGGGGAAYANLFNCTLSGNSANKGGGTSGGSLRNCIVYYNSAADSRKNYYGGTLLNCCTWPLPAGNGNMTNEPCFANADAGDYRLQARSPCVDAGLTETWMSAANDIRGSPRVFNSAVDIGAYEFTVTTECRVLLAGPHRASSQTMVTALFDADLIPTVAPYVDDHQTSGGAPSSSVDWVVMGLVPTNGTRAVGARGCYLRDDGTVMTHGGLQTVRLECSPGHYYLVAKHRNHLAAMSAHPLAYTNELVSYDFTTGPDKYWGGTNACVELEPGVWGLIAGDADGDGRTTPTDRAIVTQQMGRTGYLSGDLNLDGKVDGDD